MNSSDGEQGSRPQSPEMAPQREPSRPPRGRSRTPRSRSASMEEAPAPRRRRRGGQQQQQGQQGGLGLPAVGEVDQLGDTVGNTLGGASKTVGGVTNALGGLTGGGEEENGEKKDTLKLRLDLNLDVWVELKAKVHGDVTLSLLS